MQHCMFHKPIPMFRQFDFTTFSFRFNGYLVFLAAGCAVVQSQSIEHRRCSKLIAPVVRCKLRHFWWCYWRYFFLWLISECAASILQRQCIQTRSLVISIIFSESQGMSCFICAPGRRLKAHFFDEGRLGEYYVEYKEIITFPT